MPIGSSWAVGSWVDGAWADHSWADAGAPPEHSGQRHRRIGMHIGIGLSLLISFLGTP